MSARKPDEVVRDVLLALDGLTPEHALQVLHQAEGRLLERLKPGTRPPLKVVSVINPDLKRRVRAGRPPRIEQDPEIRDFLLNLRGHHTIVAIQALVAARFGNARAPSKSAIHRWLHGLTEDR